MCQRSEFSVRAQIEFISEITLVREKQNWVGRAGENRIQGKRVHFKPIIIM